MNAHGSRICSFGLELLKPFTSILLKLILPYIRHYWAAFHSNDLLKMFHFHFISILFLSRLFLCIHRCLQKYFLISGLCLLFALGLVLTLSFTYLNLLPRYVQILSITCIASPISLYSPNHPWGLKYRYAVQILNYTPSLRNCLISLPSADRILSYSLRANRLRYVFCCQWCCCRNFSAFQLDSPTLGG